MSHTWVSETCAFIDLLLLITSVFYFISALAVFPFSVWLERQKNTVVFQLSTAGTLFLPMLEELKRYCQIKTMRGGIEGWQVHQCLERRPTQCALARRGPLHALKSRTSKALLMYQFQRIGSLFYLLFRFSFPPGKIKHTEKHTKTATKQNTQKQQQNKTHKNKNKTHTHKNSNKNTVNPLTWCP